jgi:hypothetical protein
MGPSTDMPCQEFVELVTAYLDGALSSADRERCERHRRTCAGCRTYFAQMQAVVGSLGRLRRDNVEENGGERDRLLTLFRTRGLHSRAPRKRNVPLGIGDAFAAPGDHIGYFWEFDHEFDATVDFLAAGLERDEVCVLSLRQDAANARVLAGLERRGFSLGDLRRRDRFYTISGRQPVDALLRETDDLVRTAVDQGVPMVRILGTLGWEHSDWAAQRDHLSLEARLTEALRNLPCVLVCTYDVRGLSGRHVLGGLECHPWTLRHGALRQNEHYVPTEQFLARLAIDAE